MVLLGSGSMEEIENMKRILEARMLEIKREVDSIETESDVERFLKKAKRVDIIEPIDRRFIRGFILYIYSDDENDLFRAYIIFYPVYSAGAKLIGKLDYIEDYLFIDYAKIDIILDYLNKYYGFSRIQRFY